MSEMAKTVTFVALAVVSLFAAFMTGPSDSDFDFESEVGKRLNQFDVEDAKRLRIVTFDQETATTHDFEVAEESGLWTIPSKQGYPADAVRQMAEAATCLIDREVLRIAAENASQHAELGLIDPTSSNLNVDATGVGTRVSLTDIDGAPLADMIIGKEVPETEDQRYVRNADQDVAYVVNLQTDALTTQFDDWIEKDLLKLNPLDIRQLHIKDYSAEFQPVLTAGGIQLQVAWDRRGEMELEYDNTDSKWTATKLQKFDSATKDLTEFTLAEDETLDEDALRELRNGLDDLTIVDVERKPAGLSADLKAGSDFVKNQEAQSSLITRGFAPLPASDGSDLDILSTEGEFVCTLENGVEYVLRFGNLQIDAESSTADPQTATDDVESDDGIHRYLFVMARFNDTMIEKPKLAELPELPEVAEEATAEATEETGEPNAEESPADEEVSETETEAEEASDDDVQEAEDDTEADSTDATEQRTDNAEEEQPKAEDEQDNELTKLIAERKAIEEENQRLLNEYQEKVDAAKETVKELNERFGDWYYVIDNNVYKQIHLSRDDVIKAKEEETEEGESEAPAAPPAGIPGLPNLSPGQ